jgi:hypothetical protein
MNTSGDFSTERIANMEYAFQMADKAELANAYTLGF